MPHSRNSEWDKWYFQHARDYLDLLKQDEICVCCGERPVFYDHIVPITYERASHHKSYQEIIADLKRGNLQFLCKRCNLSKAAIPTCRLHNKYLGIWNYLPELEDMEVVN